MDKLIAGYRRYRAERWPYLRALHERLALGQQPRLLVIACSDSRVDPATIFDAEPGELFIIRNVAALAPPYEETAGYHGTSSAIEFAVEQLQVSTILVMGHAQCGGCAAALARGDRNIGRFLDAWVGLLDPAKARIEGRPGDPAVALEYESIKVTLENLMTFPFVAARVNAGTLKLAGARYGIADGGLEIYDPKADVFTTIT
ncbi:MAG: carbonic anhydrase [Hyphomonadaceae bacterium]